MSIPIEMPKLSDTMTEGTLLRWIKKVGDPIEVGDVIAEVETDKATMEMEAFDEGTLSEVYVKEGETVQVGQKLAVLVGAEESTKASGKAASASKQPETKKQPEAKEASVVEPEGKEPQGAASAHAAATPGTETRVKASPLARKVAAELGVDLAGLSGSGPGGRIVQSDVLSAKQKQPAAPAPAPKPAVAERAITPAPAAQADKTIQLTGMRRTIAARLLEAKTTIPHFYLQAELDAEPLVQLRQQLNTANEASGLSKFTVNDFILKATAVAATRVPQANAAFAGDAVVQYGAVHLACAVAIEEGLVTPVIRNAEAKSLSQISAEIKDLAAKARSKKLKPEQYQGGTLTVSNLGGYGVEQFFAIINPPQSLIVSVGAILKKPAVNSAGAIVVGQRLIIGLSCDHRVVDGAVGAQFLAEFKRLIEVPALMLV
jgi:pyruvate dehydrogenase E2 component (dihydrolipoamide acetyltransferase)